MGEPEGPTFTGDAIAAAVHQYHALIAQGGVVRTAAFGVAAVTLQQRLNVSLGTAARLLEFLVMSSGP